MLVEVRAIVILHQSGIAVVKINDAVGEKIFLVVEMNLLGRNTIGPICLGMSAELDGDLLNLDTLGDFEMYLTSQDR